MTGVVTAAFNQQVNDAALAQQQAKTSALEQNLATLPSSLRRTSSPPTRSSPKRTRNSAPE
jgi:hypothetical protein